MLGYGKYYYCKLLVYNYVCLLDECFAAKMLCVPNRFDLQEIPSKPAKRFVRVVMKSEKGIFVKLTRRLINQR